YLVVPTQQCGALAGVEEAGEVGVAVALALVGVDLAVDAHCRVRHVLDQRQPELAQQRHRRAALEVLLHVALGGGAAAECDRLEAAADARRALDDERLDAGLADLTIAYELDKAGI